jgi:aspartyl-tRNA(Asn)/glutamyl-tRNA(Gln) amidotransferase subunit C
MADISVDDVKKLAQLSALTLDDSQLTAMTTELQAILGYVEQLGEVDTRDLLPTYQVNGLENIMRDDQIINYNLGRDQLLANTPDQQDGQIKVPRVLG